MPFNDFGLSSSGFIMPTRQQALLETQSLMQSSLPSLSFEENSVESGLSQVMAGMYQDLLEVAFSVYTSQDPTYASGCSLDLIGVRNGIQRIQGESDGSLRNRITAIISGSGSLSGNSCFDRLFSQIFSIPNVTDVQINLNETSEIAGNLPPHSYEVMVIGGDEQLIANAIWANHPPGITIHGNTDVQIVDCSNVCRTVSFTRPIFVPIFIDIRLERISENCGCPTNDTTVIRNAIRSYIEGENGVCFNRIGQPVSAQEFLPAIYNNVSGVGVTCAKISRDCLSARSDFVTMKGNEVPFLDVDSFNIEFTQRDQTPCQTSVYVSPPPNCAFSLELEVVPDISEFTTIGQVITYNYTVRNIGNIAVQGPIEISDSRSTPLCQLIAPSGLQPNQEITCTSTYAAVYEDALAGGIIAESQAISGTSFSSVVRSTVSYSGTPLLAAMDLQKVLSSGICNQLGNVLEYEYTITNTGNVAITGQPVITDDRIPGIICPPIPTGGLLPSQSISTVASTIVTQQMLNDGEICNTARASASTILGSLSSNSVTLCINCSDGGTVEVNNPPVPPSDVLINQCSQDLPYTSLSWTDSSGPVSLSDNNTASALNLGFNDNGDNTATISANGNIINGTIVITGVNSAGISSTQRITVNCQDIEQSTGIIVFSCVYTPSGSGGAEGGGTGGGIFGGGGAEAQ